MDVINKTHVIFCRECGADCELARARPIRKGRKIVRWEKRKKLKAESTHMEEK